MALKDGCGLIAGAVACCAGAAGAQVFQPLGYPAGFGSSMGIAVSGDGTVVAANTSRMVSFNGSQWPMPVGARWTAGGGWQLAGIDCRLEGVSADGSTLVGEEYIVGVNGVTANRALYWRPPAAPVFFAPPGATAYSASADGAVIVGSLNQSGHSESYRWTEAGGFALLGHAFPDAYGFAAAVSADGSVLTGWDGQFTASAEGYVWSASRGMVSLGVLPGGSGNQVNPVAISADGRYIVGSSVGSTHWPQAFLWWEPGGMRPLPYLPGRQQAWANGVSADGSVVVGGTRAPGLYDAAFVWNRVSGMHELQTVLVGLGASNLAGWHLTSAASVSANGGVIVGTGTDPQGGTQAFIARVPAFCYANCDGSTAVPVLNVNDFTCFLTRFAAGDAYTNCDRSTTPPVVNVVDFACFLTAFAAGCPQ